MKKIFILVLLTSMIIAQIPLFSNDLGDFKESVEQEEEENQRDEQKDSSDNEYEDDDGNPFLRLLWEFTFLLWFIHNESVYYTPYPYEPISYVKGDNFIGHELGSAEEVKALDPYRKNYYFALYGGASIDEDFNTIGGMARLTGKFFNHLGPELDYRILWDGTDFFHMLNTGMNLSFFQLDYLSLDFHIKGAFFFGILERQGISLGARLYTYPFKPISLEVRSGGLFFSSITFAEVEVKLGFHLGRSEIFADFYTLQSRSTALYSFGIGMGVHF